MDQTKFRGLIGSLLFLTTRRLDIMFNVCMCARFQANPKESHYNVAKMILKYLKGTTNVGLWYPNEAALNLKGTTNVGLWYPNEATLNLKGNLDLDFTGRKLDCTSTSGTCHLLRASLISWNNKKQACVAISTAEAEYIATGSRGAQIS